MKSPTTPLRAHHRFLLTILKSHVPEGKKYEPTPVELDRVSTVFGKAGGSWARLFNGSVDDVDLAKRVLKIAAEKGHLSAKSNWGV